MTAFTGNSQPNSAVTTRAEEASGSKPDDTFLSQLAEVRVIMYSGDKAAVACGTTIFLCTVCLV